MNLLPNLGVGNTDSCARADDYGEAPLGELSEKDEGVFPRQKRRILLYNQSRPAKMRAYFALSSWAEWELVADDENTPLHIVPVRNSVRKLPRPACRLSRRFAQRFPEKPYERP